MSLGSLCLGPAMRKAIAIRLGAGLALGLLLAASNAAGRGGSSANELTERLSVGEVWSYIRQDKRLILKRFADYKQLGIGNVRVSFSWGEMEKGTGGSNTWRKNSPTLKFLELAKNSGIRLRLNVNALKPPTHMRKELENAGLLMKNLNGDFSPTLSYWHPETRNIVVQKTAKLFQYLKDAAMLDDVSALIVPLGPAGEPVYPAAWMTGRKKANDISFWFYDSYARDDFVARMRALYGAIESANEAWGTEFGGWSDVMIPKEGTRGGGMWRDVLTWYRDSKRRFIVWQVRHYKELLQRYYPVGNRPDLVMLITGDRISESEWESAVQRGTGGHGIKVMIDHDFLIDTAYENGLVLQQAGMQDEKSLSATIAYMKRKGFQLKMWGENNRNETDPITLVDVGIKLGLFGFEYLHVNNLFNRKGEKTALYSRFAEAIERFQAHVSPKISSADCRRQQRVSVIPGRGNVFVSGEGAQAFSGDACFVAGRRVVEFRDYARL